MPHQGSPTSSRSIRPPAVAGRFYPADPAACRAEAQSYLDQAIPSWHGLPARDVGISGARSPSPTSPSAGEDARAPRWLGGIVPHAGWVCSGAIAGQTIAALAATNAALDIIVVFGAVHTPAKFEFGALDSHAGWATPGSQTALPLELEEHLLEKGNLFAIEPRLHQNEHAVEVEVPLIQLAWPSALLLPIETPAVASAALIGRKTAQVIASAGLRAVYLASSDLTHYGTNYRFTPAGVGPSAMQWAKDNDRRLLDLIEKFDIDAILPESQAHQNACGAGAIAAMLAACREHGATTARTISHATSYETLAKVAPQPPTNAVGYAAVMVG